MPLATSLLLLTLSASQFEPPVTIRCQLDTKLPLDEIRVSITEMRERKSVPGSDGGVTLPGLPAGDIHLSFFQRDILIGQIELRSANEGEFIRLKVRLVTGNAILLDEFRVKGVSGVSPPPTKSLPAATPLNDLPSGADSEPTTVEKSTTRPAPQPTRPPTEFARPPKRTSSTCPAPGDTITRTGKLSRIIDNDSFELFGSDRRNYVVYVGSATRVKRGSRLVTSSALREGLGILVKGTVAAGPEDECSIGAREVIVQRQ